MRFTFFLASILFFSFSFAQENDDGSIPDGAANGVQPIQIVEPRVTIYSYLSETDGEYNVLTAAIDALGLEENLNAPGGRLTLFAPTDSALANLAREMNPGINLDQSNTEDVVAALQTGIEKLRELKESKFASLRDVVVYHIIGSANTYQQLETKSPVTTNAGKKISVIDGQIVDFDPRQNVSAVTQNIFLLNGWVHAVQTVLLPFDLEEALEAYRLLTPTPSPSPTTTPVPSASEAPTPTDEVQQEVGPIEEPSTPSEEPVATPGSSEEEVPTTAEVADPSPEDEDGSVCFPGDATIRTADGSHITMSELEAGHNIHVSEQGAVSRVFAFTHKTNTRKTVFYKVEAANGKMVRLTGSHYLYANGRLTAAKAVKVGDVLRTVDGNSKVIRTTKEKGVGLYAPHTLHGDLVVDGVVVSGYSRAVVPWLAHALLAPVRMAAKLGVTEPLGRMLYDGADGMAAMMPSGHERY